jgi:hypothetical protein
MDTKVNLVSINQNVNFEDIDILAKEVISSCSCDLNIPDSLVSSGGFGIEGAVLQLIATWLRNSSTHTLYTSALEPEPDQFESLCNSLFGLCTLRLSDKILTTSDKEVSLKDALTPAIRILSEIRNENFNDAYKGLYIGIPSIKSIALKGSRNREFEIPLYNNCTIVGAEKFLHLTKKLITAATFQQINLADIDSNIVVNISEILRELFTNTDRHARTDVNGNPFEKSFSAVAFNMSELSEERINTLNSSGGKRALFFSEWMPENDQNFRALEITITDSGPGYARRWHKLDKDELTIENEMSAVVDCFKKHNTTDTSDSSGSGLTNVLRDLKSLKGWIRLRTGRVLMEKSFFSHKGTISIDDADLVKREAFLEGVTINLVIPLESLTGKKNAHI